MHGVLKYSSTQSQWSLLNAGAGDLAPGGNANRSAVTNPKRTHEPLTAGTDLQVLD